MGEANYKISEIAQSTKSLKVLKQPNTLFINLFLYRHCDLSHHYKKTLPVIARKFVKIFAAIFVITQREIALANASQCKSLMAYFKIIFFNK